VCVCVIYAYTHARPNTHTHTHTHTEAADTTWARGEPLLGKQEIEEDQIMQELEVEAVIAVERGRMLQQVGLTQTGRNSASLCPSIPAP